VSGCTLSFWGGLFKISHPLCDQGYSSGRSGGVWFATKSMKRPLARRDFPAGRQADKEGDKEPGTRFPKRDPTFPVLVTVSFALIGIMTALLIGDIHELRSGTLLGTPRPVPAFTTASLPRTDSQSVQIAAPAPSPALASNPEIDRTAPLAEAGQNMLESTSEHFSAAESQFDRPRQTTVRRKTWVKRSSNAPHKTTDARRQPHKKQILDSALRSIGRALGF